MSATCLANTRTGMEVRIQVPNHNVHTLTSINVLVQLFHCFKELSKDERSTDSGTSTAVLIQFLVWDFPPACSVRGCKDVVMWSGGIYVCLLACPYRGILTYLREFVNYRHPDPRRGEPRVCSTQLDAFPVQSINSRSGRSAAEFREAHPEAPLSQFWHIWPENGYPF